MANTPLMRTIRRLGVATAAEVDIDASIARMHNEMAASGSIIVSRSEIGAWSGV